MGGRIGIVGGGRVARAMALGLGDGAARPPLLWARDAARARAAAAAVGAQAAGAMAALRECGMIVLAVSDDAVAGVAQGLAAHVRPGAFVFHVSGRSGAAVLEPLRQAGALTAAVHPAMTFTGDPKAEVARMAGARFAVTAPDAAGLERARSVVARLGGVAVEVPEAQRSLYHAALCHGANHLVTLIAGAGDALRAAGVTEPGALLGPLVRAALENSLAHGFTALTGPVLRGDAETVAGHVAALGRDCPAVLPAYRAMAGATVAMLKAAGRSADEALRAAIDAAD